MEATYNYVNTSTTAEPKEEFLQEIDPYKTEYLIFTVSLFAFIVLANGAVLFTLLCNHQKICRTNFFIMHLAFADICNGMVSVLTKVIWKSTEKWYAGLALCKIVRFFMSLTTFASNYVLVSLSIDRLDAIANPMNFPNARRRSRISIALAWCLASLFSVPMLIFNQVQQVLGVNQCWIVMGELGWMVYITVVTALVFVIPATIIAACYVIIVRVVWRKHSHGQLTTATPANKGYKAMKHSTSASSTSASSTRSQVTMNTSISGKSCGSETKSPRVQKEQGLIPKAKIKTVKMTLVIVFAFIFCWMPYFVFDLLQVYRLVVLDTKRLLALNAFIQGFGSLHSAVNPITYFIFNNRAYAQLRKRICRKRRKKAHRERIMTSKKLIYLPAINEK